MGADPVLADALSTAIMVLGPEAGMSLVERTPGVGAAIVTAGNEVAVSPSLKDRLRILKPPTS